MRIEITPQDVRDQLMAGVREVVSNTQLVKGLERMLEDIKDSAIKQTTERIKELFSRIICLEAPSNPFEGSKIVIEIPDTIQPEVKP